MLRVPVGVHLWLDGILGVLSPGPAVAYFVVQTARHHPHDPLGDPALGWVRYTALALLVLGVALGRLIPWFLIVARCPDCGGTARPGRARRWRLYGARHDGELVYRCSACGGQHPTGWDSGTGRGTHTG